MKTILKLFTATFVTSSSILTVVACGSHTTQTKESVINPSIPTAKKEANEINNKTIDLSDTVKTKYEDKTAQQDVTAIDNAIVTAGYLNTTQVKDFSFDSSKHLTIGNNTGIGFNVNTPDGSKASGKININIKSFDWYKNMKLQGKDKFEAAYDGYYLNKKVGLTQDWLNFNSQNPSKTIYFLLPGVTNTKDALKDIDVKDSAGLQSVFGYPYDDSNIQWAQDKADSKFTKF